MTIAARTVSLLLLATAMAGCSDEPTGPVEVSRADIIQAYEATLLSGGPEGGPVVDILTMGASLSLELHDDGTTTGQFISPEIEGDGPIDASLAGTFTFDDATDQISFQQEADTFVRAIVLTASWSDGEVMLEGQESFVGGSVHVILAPTE